MSNAIEPRGSRLAWTRLVAVFEITLTSTFIGMEREGIYDVFA